MQWFKGPAQPFFQSHCGGASALSLPPVALSGKIKAIPTMAIQTIKEISED